MNTPKILMMFLGTGGEIDERLRGSLLVAQHLKAHLRIVHTQLDSNSLLPDDLAIPVVARSELTDVMDRITDSESENLNEKFQLLCKEMKVPFVPGLQQVKKGKASASWIDMKGLRSNLVGSYGKLADWIVMPRPPEGRVTASFEAAVLETGRPVLVIPRQLKQFKLDNIQLGWNYRAEAAKALSAAIPQMQVAKQVKVVTSIKNKGYLPKIEEVAEYLALHGIEATTQVITTKVDEPGKALLKQAKKDAADLIVIGAYSKRRIRDLLFGDVTRYLLKESDIPVLMVH